ncbi:MAG: C2H2-type zinc finger protein [Planctomycetota bacterium]|jgi:hypothetical protein
MFECEECKNEFKTKAALGSHKKQKHQVKEPETKQETTKHLSLTSDQQAIAERVAKQDTSWMTIREDELEDFSLINNPYDLMPEAAKEQNEKRFAFRWCTRTPQRIDELTRSVQPPLRWAICTRNTTPFLAQYVDDLLGCITQGDQVLLYKPWSHHELVKQAKAELAGIQDDTGRLAGKKQQMEREDIKVMEGADYKITSSDEVVADEGVIDSNLGIQDDSSALGDLVVAE